MPAKSFSLRCLLLAGISIALSSTIAFAQQVPSSAQPGIVTRSLEQPDRSHARLEDIIVIPKAEQAQGEGSTEKIFVLNAVVLDGSSAYTATDFTSVYSPFLHQKVSFADLNTIALGMTRKYREDGYVFSRVILPPQKIKDGVLHLQAIEGRITNVTVESHVKDANGLIQAFADKIRSAGPANTKEIERYLLLIDDLPGITARSVVKPSQTQGGGDLVIVVEENPFEGSIGINNRGSQFIGPWRGEVVGAVNSLFGLHDRTTLRGISSSDTQELLFGELTHEEQLGSEGTRVKGRYALTATEPGGSLSPLGIQGDSKLFDIELLHPLLRSRQVNINLLSGFNLNNTQTDLAGLEIARDHVRSLRISGNVDFTDSWRGINQLECTATKGLDVLGATDDGTGRSRANGKHEFTRYNVTATRIQDLWRDLSLSLSGTAQMTHDPLLASEEFTVGGEAFGRGYDAGEIAGDKGYAGSAELRYGGPLNNAVLQSYQLYTFVDYGRITNLSPVVGEAERDSLSSAGFGVRFNTVHDISGYLELATPLNQTVNAEGDDGSRLFFNALKRF